MSSTTSDAMQHSSRSVPATEIGIQQLHNMIAEALFRSRVYLSCAHSDDWWHTVLCICSRTLAIVSSAAELITLPPVDETTKMYMQSVIAATMALSALLHTVDVNKNFGGRSAQHMVSSKSYSNFASRHHVTMAKAVKPHDFDSYLQSAQNEFDHLSLNDAPAIQYIVRQHRKDNNSELTGQLAALDTHIELFAQAVLPRKHRRVARGTVVPPPKVAEQQHWFSRFFGGAEVPAHDLSRIDSK